MKENQIKKQINDYCDKRIKESCIKNGYYAKVKKNLTN